MIFKFNDFINENLDLVRGIGNNMSGNVDLYGRGLYLTDDIDIAKFYGNKIEHHSINGKIFDTTKTFTSTELRKFFRTLDNILKTNIGSKILQDIIDYNDGKLPKDTGVDYLEISYSLNSNYEFQQVLNRNNLLTNTFNSYANDCTAMNLALANMGYVGLKYPSSQIDDLDDIGLGNKTIYLIFPK